MRHLVVIAAVFISMNAPAQLQSGTYLPDDTLEHAKLEIYPDNKFSFHDMRLNSCWLWSRYEGDWKLAADTLIFQWQAYWQEDQVKETRSIDTISDFVSLTFIYDDGEPIPGVKVCYTCDWYENCRYFYTGRDGKVNVSRHGLLDFQKKPCSNTTRQLSY